MNLDFRCSYKSKNNGEKLLPRSQQGSFLHEHAHQDLINGTRPVTATVVHGIGTKFFAIKSFLEIQMVAGTLKEWINNDQRATTTPLSVGIERCSLKYFSDTKFVYRKIVEVLVFAGPNIVTRLVQEFSFSQNSML